MSITADNVLAARRSCTEKIASAEAELLRLHGELAAYDGLLSAAQPKPKEATEAARVATPESRKRPRKPPGTWEAIMNFIGTETKAMQTILDFSADRGVEITNNNLRSQMSNYRKAGLIASDTEKGEYRLTEKGMDRFGISRDSTSAQINGSEARQHVIAH